MYIIYPQKLPTYIDIIFFEKTDLHPQVMPHSLHQAKGTFQSVSQLICWNWDEKITIRS